MLIDRKAKPWFFISLAIFVIATGFYIPYSRGAFGKISGGSWPGLAYGAVGSAAMVITMLLAGRKKLRSWQLGRVYHWMQAHVWLGLVSYPLILCHAGGLSWGGSLTQILMWIFTAVIVSGIVGIVFQQTLPRTLMREVPAETIYDQIDHVLEKLREEADAVIRPIRAESEASEVSAHHHGGVATLRARQTSADPLEKFYTAQIVPFLADRMPAGSVLAANESAEGAFEQLRGRLSEDLHPAVARLQSLVSERRQLARQRQLHLLLHGWLLVHVPLSYVLIVLAIVHAIMASRYMPATP
jgi:hypothetical protein